MGAGNSEFAATDLVPGDFYFPRRLKRLMLLADDCDRGNPARGQDGFRERMRVGNFWGRCDGLVPWLFLFSKKAEEIDALCR